MDAVKNIDCRDTACTKACLAHSIEDNNSHAQAIIANCGDAVNAQKIGGKKHLGLKQVWISEHNFRIMKLENMSRGDSSCYVTLNRILEEYYSPTKRKEIFKNFEKNLK